MLAQSLVDFVATHLSDLDEQGDAAWSYEYDTSALAEEDDATAAGKIS